MKLNNKFKAFALVGMIALATGCSEDFLDTPGTTSFINSQDLGTSAIKNPKLFDATLSGIYSALINTGTGGTTDHDDFGQKGYDIFSDMLSSDMALSTSTYGWYRRFTSYQTTTDNTRIENYKPWRFYYRIIRGTNVFINSIGGNDAVPSTDEGKHAMGQAKAIRAYAYFYLSQFYIKEYTPTSKVLPILTDPSQSSIPQSTTEEVYNLMIKDLTEAVNLLNGFTRKSKNQINQDVAKALLAYVYGAMNTPDANAKAKTLTSQIINSGSYPLMSSSEVVGGFNDINTPGWMWGFDLTLDMGFDLISWWGQMDVFTYSYQWAGDNKSIDAGLYDLIPANDIRKTQFLFNPSSGYHLIPFRKFYDSARQIGGQRNVVTDYVFMRVAEMYLLNAEFAAKTGDEATAKTSLKAVVSKRVPDATYIDALSGQALLDEIYLQTRIELFAEGKSYLAMKRFKATIKRGSNHLSNVGESVPYNADKLTWTIPLSEIQNNPFIN